MTITRILIVINKDKPHAQAIANELSSWLKEQDINSSILETAYKTHFYPALKAAMKKADLVAVLGGDGTMLKVLQVTDTDVPVLGINMGGLGFLTEIPVNEMYNAFTKVISGAYITEKRLMLEVLVKEGHTEVFRCLAFNDAVINRGSMARIITIDVYIDDVYLSSFKADGIIISTPTGSTAYSLSAGGPIIYPTVQAILVNPICPHSLTHRPMVLPIESLIRIVPISISKGTVLTVDGQITTKLNADNDVFIKACSKTFNIIRLKENPHFNTYRSKLRWGSC